MQKVSRQPPRWPRLGKGCGQRDEGRQGGTGLAQEAGSFCSSSCATSVESRYARTSTIVAPAKRQTQQ